MRIVSKDGDAFKDRDKYDLKENCYLVLNSGILCSLGIITELA